MQLLDLTLPTPEQNLALDEALLDAAEAGSGSMRGPEFGGETLRFWESRKVFAVLGFSRKAAEDVRLDACRRDKIPVLRRPSGGGTVLQGPGCLNFALILRIDHAPELGTIRGTNAWVLTRMASALKAEAAGVELKGISDLAIKKRKFSGTAQRRKRSYLLFHGTILHGFDLALIEKYLAQPKPADQPDYRQNRNHADFLTQLPLPPPQIKYLLTRAWHADPPEKYRLKTRVTDLVQTRYSSTDWNLKY